MEKLKQMRVSGVVKEYSYSSRVVINDYIPFSVSFSKKNDTSTNQYFRFGNGVTSLTEVCIDSETGLLKEIIVVLVANCIYAKGKFDLEGFEIETGMPLFSLREILKDEIYVDEFSSDDVITIFDDAFVLDTKKYSANEKVLYIQCGDVIFAMNDDKLVVRIILLLNKKFYKKHILSFCI